MDDTWRHAKCSSTWTPPPPSSSPAPPPRPATAEASAASSANQIDMNPRPIFLPFIAQGANLENGQVVKDSLVFHTLNLDFAKSGKTELGNSLLSLLSANPHRLPSEFSQLSKPPAHGGGIIGSSASPSAQVITLPTLSQKWASDSMWNVKIPSFDQSKSSLMPDNPKSLFQAHRSLHVATSHCIASTSSELNSGQGVWPTNSRPDSIGQHHSLNIQTNQTLQRMSTEASSCVRTHDSAHSRGRPRVFCMKTVGEMFLSELGLLGVICFCHNQRMSVAKFCEHSGSSANPGDAIRLENGMTVARWRKLCFGNNAPDDGKGWDWSDRASAKNGSIRSTATLPQNPWIVDSVRSAVGFAKSGDPLDKSSYSKLPCTRVTPVSIKQPTNKGKGFTIAPQSHVSILPKNHTKHGVEANPHCLNCETPHGALDKGEPNVLSRLVKISDNSIGKLGTRSIIYPHSDATSLSREFSSSRNSFASEAFIITKDGKSSNIDLRLGQPSQVHTSLSYVSTGLNQMQFGVVHNPQKSQANLPLTYKSDCPMENKKPKIGFWCTSPKQSTTNRGQSQQAVVSSNTSDVSEPKELIGSATKNSLVSMFLSHLNSKGSSASHLTTTIKNGKYSMLDPASTKHNLSEDTNDGNRMNPFDGSNFSDNLDKGKRPRFSDNGFYNTVEANHLAHNNQIAGTRFPIQSVGGKCLQNGSSVDDRRFSLNFNQPSRSVQPKPDSVNFSQYGKVPLGINNYFNCATNGSVNPFSYAASRPVTLNSGTSMNTTSSNPVCISETASVLTHVKSTDHSHHLTDDNMKFLASRHMVDFSRKDQSTTTFKRSPMHQRLCCHLSTPEDITQGSYSDIQQNASGFAVRSVESCSHCFSGFGAESLATKPGIRGRRESCNCAILTQRNSQCSKEHNISTCHVCWASEHPCLRLGRLSNCGFHGAKQTFDVKEHAKSSYGKCCCSMIAKHSLGCCLSGDLSPSDSSNKQTVCGKAGMKHTTQACDEVQMFEDRNSVGLCECTKKQSVMKNDGQIGLWKDVPAKKIGHSDAASIDKPAQVLDFSRGSNSDGFEGAQGFDTMNEQQMSNAFSGSSAPAVTEISVEVKEGNYCPLNGEDNNCVADEGSGVEKCGSSDVREYEENPTVNGKVDTDYSEFSMPSHLPGDSIDELRQQTTSNKKKAGKQTPVQCTDQEHIMKEKVQKEEKRNEQMKTNQLSMSVPKAGWYPINSESSHCVSLLKWELSPPGENSESIAPSQCETIMGRSSVKRKRSSLSAAEPLSLKINNHDNILEIDRTQSVNDVHSLRILASLSEEEELTVHREKQFAKQDKNHLDSQKPPKYLSLNCIAKPNTHAKEIIDKKVKPVVCGKSGIISNGGMDGQRKPAKIVSMSLILKRSKRCDVNEYGKKPKKSLATKTKKMHLKENNGSCNDLPAWKLPCKNETPTRNGTHPSTVCSFGKNNQCFSKCNVQTDTFSVIENETNIGSNEEEEPAQARPKYREVSKLLGKDNHGTELSYPPNSGASCNLTLNGTGDQRKTYPSVIVGDSLVDFGSGKSSSNNEERVGELSQINIGSFNNIEKCQTNLSSLDAFCCVCGSSNKEDINCLLECNRCLINVHQACYGVSKVPQGHWFCRPCKTNSQNTACVLCGYDGGAMTRALKSQDIVKSLLKAWNFGTFVKFVSSDETVRAGSTKPGFVDEASKHKKSGSDTAVRSACSETFPEASMDLYSQIRTGDLPKGLQLCNSITAGVFDPSVTQWVHMVCGLWTPGTRCPNVDTMNAFDVLGATAARKSTVCSVCNRPGGCCIQCRVPKCPDYFHPWCAHQKGLLQSEIEGENNEKVGFYGRCMLHAAQDGIHFDSHPVNVEVETPGKDWSCVRIEGFKDPKSEDQRPAYSESGGCIVSQEQINAWQHINGQKPCARAGIKRPSSDIEHDFWDFAANPCYWKKMDKTCIHLSQKEYLRYKQSKARKHLVVYKSGIHALGLYTSQPIARGAMVVEYVGEVVGLRVADKREIEYQSGRRLQYKSACYFFRIDKEHIIDATRKGGIARFVNHSCEPNCVAKVISVRYEKKVVFFAERDINPGEEITYDYHFNSEDEGEKIPCYCNSKNCRRYLN